MYNPVYKTCGEYPECAMTYYKVEYCRMTHKKLPGTQNFVLYLVIAEFSYLNFRFESTFSQILTGIDDFECVPSSFLLRSTLRISFRPSFLQTSLGKILTLFFSIPHSLTSYAQKLTT
jgi:hypothetical protein